MKEKFELPKFTKNEAPHVNPEDVNFIRATSLDLGKSKMSIDEGGLDLRETQVLANTQNRDRDEQSRLNEMTEEQLGMKIIRLRYETASHERLMREMNDKKRELATQRLSKEVKDKMS